LNKILQTQKDIRSKHYSVVSQKSALSLQTFQSINNAAERLQFSNADRPDVSRNSSAV